MWCVATKATARRAAWELVQAVWRDGAYANIAWPEILGRGQLSNADRAFATELAYGTLRKWGLWGQIVESAGGRRDDTLDPGVWWVLLLGTHQLLALQTPAHAAVNESVELAKETGFRSATGLVNAILRKVAARSEEQWVEVLSASTSDPLQRSALRGAHPVWVTSLLHDALERESAGAELDALLQAHNTPARVTLAVLRGDPDGETTPFSPLGSYVSGAPGDDPRVREGTARVQDEGSQLAALVAAEGFGVPADARVVDACAGPGGKTAVLATRFTGVVALEQHHHRAKLVRQAVAGVSQDVDVRQADALEYFADHPGEADLVLLDAPCLGLGALRRRPEARWTKSAADLEGLVQTQRGLLAAAVTGLRPGGVVVYVTCSPVVAETTEQVDWLLQHHREMEAIDTGPVLDAVARTPVPHSRVGTAVQLWPHRHGTDAMFIQALRRQA